MEVNSPLLDRVKIAGGGGGSAAALALGEVSREKQNSRNKEAFFALSAAETAERIPGIWGEATGINNVWFLTPWSPEICGKESFRTSKKKFTSLFRLRCEWLDFEYCKKLRGLLPLRVQIYVESPWSKLWEWVHKLQGCPHRAGWGFVWRVRDHWTRRSHVHEEVREVTPARTLRCQRGAAEILYNRLTMAEQGKFNSQSVIERFFMRTFLSAPLVCGFMTKYTKVIENSVIEQSMTMILRAGTTVNCSSWTD